MSELGVEAKPLISVLVPAYNAENYIENCLKSIIRQTYKKIEILVLDDGSTDRTGDIAESFSVTDNRIKVIHTENSGVAVTRNKLLDLASGDLIFQVDADDYICDNAIELLFTSMIKADSDISTGMYIIGNRLDYSFSEIEEPEIEVLSGNERFYHLFDGEKLCFISPCLKLYKKELFNGLRYPAGRIHEDEYLAHEILDRAEKVVFLKSPVYYYVVKKDSITRSDFSFNRLDCVPALLERNAFFENKGNEDLIRLCYFEFLKRFQYYYYGVRYHYPNEKNVINRLYGQYKEVYEKATDRGMLGLKEKILFGLFLKSPNINYLARTILRKKAIDT